MTVIAAIIILQGALAGASGAVDINSFHRADLLKPRMDLSGKQILSPKPARDEAVMREIEMRVRGARLLRASA